MARTITVPVFIGVLKQSADQPEPDIVVAEKPRGSRDFDRYRWFRSTVDVTVPDIAVTVPSTPATPVDP